MQIAFASRGRGKCNAAQVATSLTRQASRKIRMLSSKQIGSTSRQRPEPSLFIRLRGIVGGRRHTKTSGAVNGSHVALQQFPKSFNRFKCLLQREFGGVQALREKRHLKS